ncbi:hypothetical protein PSZ11_24090, partial [Shigella flexneri]|nr:hypothetical protein [Shigella flexneri]
IFTSPDLKPRIEAIRNGKPTTVIVANRFNPWFQIGRSENNHLIFTSPDLKPRIEAIRNGKPTTVIVA